eukprot:TRINITY_DN2903_c0_g1_i1.p1 TRINITY_DN2903_c0_g1~~TRINITY_DN2903_c0_g1_i1.p1  ORF type:complete len:411 (-),score=122.61 TRINITY_DN2903_c0_g1_i1:69-1301(-)
MEEQRSAFVAERLSERVWKVVEDDPFGQYPFMYVVVGEDKVVLIDTGTGHGGDYRGFVTERMNTRRLPYLVVNTHIHFDHVGGNHQFIPDEVHDPPSLGICMGGNNRGFSQNMEINSLVIAHPGARLLPFEVNRWLADGELIYLDDSHTDPQLALCVIYTPGHTPDSLSLYAPFDNRLFIGDFIYPFTVVHIDCLGGNASAYRQTLRKLCDFLFSAGPNNTAAVTDPSQAVATATPMSAPMPSALVQQQPRVSSEAEKAFFAATGLDPAVAAACFDIATLLELCDGSAEAAVELYLTNPGEAGTLAPPRPAPVCHYNTAPVQKLPAYYGPPPPPGVVVLSCGHVEAAFKAEALFDMCTLIDSAATGTVPSSLHDITYGEYKSSGGDLVVHVAKYQLQKLREEVFGDGRAL